MLFIVGCHEQKAMKANNINDFNIFLIVLASYFLGIMDFED